MNISDKLLTHLFDERVAANVAAAFLRLAEGELNILKLMKLMYLAERKSYQLYAEPMIGDKLVAMPRGPVLSMTYDCVNSGGSLSEDGWDGWVSDRANHMVTLNKEVDSIETLPMLSADHVALIQQTWNQFGHLDQFELVEYTHDRRNCPEWSDPSGSSFDIPLTDLFRHLGFSEQKIESSLADLYTQAQIKQAFSQAEQASLHAA